MHKMLGKKGAVCPENDALLEHMQKWWKELLEKNPQKCSPNLESNINKAFANVVRHKSPITIPKEFLAVKGVGRWMLKEMEEFFKKDTSENDISPTKGKKTRGSRAYLPQKNSVAYALLIALYRGEKNGVEHMRKQELIDEAEASGLSRGPIAPERGKGKPGHIGSSSKEWYSGWSAMGKLVDKGLVDKSSCPAKYKLSDEGRRVAIECLSRSGMLDPAQNPVRKDGCSDSDKQDAESITIVSADSPMRTLSSADLNTFNAPRDDISTEYIEKFTRLGYSKEQVLHAWTEVSVTSPNQEMSKLWLAVLCRLREDEVYGVQPVPHAVIESSSGVASTSNRLTEELQAVNTYQQNLTCALDEIGDYCTKSLANSKTDAASIRSENHVLKTLHSCSQNVLRMPPLKYLEKFEEAYKVILVLDDREHFIRSNSRNIIQKIGREFKIEIQVRRLPVGDGIWIARHKQLHTEYVLDFIVERKNVDDLRSSIRDNRYKEQKLRLLRTGIKKIIYLVEGDPNLCEAADSIKTACFTTELLEGFDVQRTSGLSDTLHRYGFLTLAITDQYQLNSSLTECNAAVHCLEYDRFIKKCNDVDKMTVSDVFATQLMQVQQVTEEIAVAVLDCYPTLYSLALAYAALDGDVQAQEELLIKESNGAVTPAASRNIFRFIWAT
ncbi:hypothetical protein RND81_03G139300 [Saponaria officinalis]|uniref:Crossover junction endonuclease MUS81 n=1 Tax=Saponaria officinalis TaxID=3572 RepID=A0AAW1M5H4_SAPOF